MPDLRGLMADPDFNALPLERRTAILARVNPKLAEDYAGLHTEENLKDLKVTPYPETGRVMTREDIASHNAMVAPVGAGDVLGGLAMVPAGVAPEIMGRVAAAAGPVVKKAFGSPVVRGAVGAAVGAQHGGLPGAVWGATEGVVAGKLPGWAGKAWRLAQQAHSAAQAAAPEASVAAQATPEAVAATQAAVRGASEVSPVLSNVTFTVGSAANAAPATATAATEAAPKVGQVIQGAVGGSKVWAVTEASGGARTFTNAREALQYSHELKRAVVLGRIATEAAPVAATAAKATPTVTKAATSATQAAPVVAPAANATRQAALANFAKEAAARNPKLGEKIWVALDDAGNPVRILTPDQAGAAKRAGHATTWVKNLWR